MSVGLAPPQASKAPLLWTEMQGEEGGRQSESGSPRSSPSTCFSPLTQVPVQPLVVTCYLMDLALFLLHSPAPSPQCAPQIHQPVVNSWPRAVTVACSVHAILGGC